MDIHSAIICILHVIEIRYFPSLCTSILYIYWKSIFFKLIGVHALRTGKTFFVEYFVFYNHDAYEMLNELSFSKRGLPK